MTDPIRRAAADALESAGGVPSMLVGFDGFLDTITSAVDLRRSMRPDDYDAMRTIEALAARVAGAGGGRSVNIELRAREVRAGGNGPLLAGALAGQGARVTLIGALGAESATPIHPGYLALVDRCEEVVSIAPSARTDALEFDDGKVMFNWSANLDPIDWPFLKAAVGLDRLTTMCARADVLATINWTNLGGLPSIWRGLREEVLPTISRPPAIFVDLSDPAKRTDDALREMLDELRALNQAAPLTLGLNFAEAQRISRLVLGDTLPTSRDADDMMHAAHRLRDAIGVATVLVHTRGMVAGAEADATAAVATRLVARPVISTGAGDHFNGGYLAARAHGLSLAQGLAAGCDTATGYVSTGTTPTRHDLIKALRSEVDLGA